MTSLSAKPAPETLPKPAKTKRPAKTARRDAETSSHGAQDPEAGRALKPKAPRKPRAKKEAAPLFRAGTVAIVGRANVGKSTLVNLLIKYKLSAVSSKPQTTRHKILGVLTGEVYQVVLFDTPGMPYKTTDVLDRRLVGVALAAMHDVDLVVMMVEGRAPGDVEHRIIRELKIDEKAAILAINKVDQGKKEALLPVMEAYSHLYPFLEIMPISALTGDGVDQLLRMVIDRLPEGQAMFEADDITDRSERFLTTEIIREQVFNAYAQEVPYAVAVELEDFREASEDHGGKDYVNAVLYANKDSQKAILIGKGGQMLKTIGTNARARIEELLERPVHLELWVRVFPQWRKDKAFLERIGY